MTRLRICKVSIQLQINCYDNHNCYSCLLLYNRCSHSSLWLTAKICASAFLSWSGGWAICLNTIFYLKQLHFKKRRFYLKCNNSNQWKQFEYVMYLLVAQITHLHSSLIHRWLLALTTILNAVIGTNHSFKNDYLRVSLIFR